MKNDDIKVVMIRWLKSHISVDLFWLRWLATNAVTSEAGMVDQHRPLDSGILSSSDEDEPSEWIFPDSTKVGLEVPKKITQGLEEWQKNVLQKKIEALKFQLWNVAI